MKYIQRFRFWQATDPSRYEVDYDYIREEFKKQGSAALRQKCITVTDKR